MELKDLILSTLEELDTKIQEDGFKDSSTSVPVTEVSENERDFT